MLANALEERLQTAPAAPLEPLGVLFPFGGANLQPAEIEGSVELLQKAVVLQGVDGCRGHRKVAVDPYHFRPIRPVCLRSHMGEVLLGHLLEAAWNLARTREGRSRPNELLKEVVG